MRIFQAEKAMRTGLIFMLCAVPLAIWPESYNLTYIKEIILSASALMLVFAFMRAKEIRISVLSACIAILPLWMAISFIFSRYKAAAVPVMCVSVIVFLIFIIMANQASVRNGQLRAIILISALPVAAIGLIQIFVPGIFKSLLAFNGRIPSTLGNPNFFAAYIVIIFPFMLAFSEKLKRATPVFIIVSGGLALFLLYKTGSKGAIAALAIEAAVYAAVTAGKQDTFRAFINKNMFPLIISAAAVIAAAVMLLHNSDSLRFRLDVWGGTLKLIGANPLFGTGPGSFSFAFPAFRPGEMMQKSYRHSYEVSFPENILLQAAAEYGIPGFLALIGAFWIILVKIQTEKKDFYAAFCGLIAVNMFGVDINFAASSMLSAVLAGTLLNGRKGLSAVMAGARKKIVFFAAGAAVVFIIIVQVKVHLSDIYLKRAVNLSGAKQWQASIENYKKALFFNPMNVPAGYFLGSAYFDSDPQANASAAIAKFEEVEKHAPDYVLLHYKKAIVFNSMGLTSQAIEEYKKMLKIDPYLKQALVDLAFIYYKNNDLNSAEEYMKSAAEKSNDPALYNNLANIYFMQKRMNESVAAYKKAVEIKPDKDYYYNLGCVYFTLNDIANARANIYKAAELDSKNGKKEAKIRNMLGLISQYEKVKKR